MSRLLSISFLLSFISVYGQTPEVVLSITPTEMEVGEVVTISVKSNVQGKMEIDNLPGTFVTGSGVYNGMEQDMDFNTGKVMTYYYMSQSGSFTKPGKYTVGPVYIKSANKVYPSNTVTINVGKKMSMNNGSLTAQQLKDPSFGVLQSNKTTIYEGESIVVGAKVYSKFNPTNIGSYNQYSIDGTIEMHEIGNNTGIRVVEERFKGMDLYSFHHDRNVIFPNGIGKVRINPFQINVYQGFRHFPLVSTALDIEIRPLPANPPKDFIGAVGQFSIERELDTLPIKQGDAFKLYLTLNGVGNLQNIIAPDLILPKGFIQYGDPIVSENITFNSRGAEGSIRYEYNVQVTNSGKQTLPPTTITYFNPKKGKYITAETSEHPIFIKPDSKYISIKNASSKQDDKKEEVIRFQASIRPTKAIHSTSKFYGTAPFWTGVSSPVLCAFLFLFFVKRRERESENIEAKQAIKKKNQASKDYLIQAKSALAAEHPGDDFYLNIERALKKAFEAKMNLQNDRVLNTSEIYDHLNNQGEYELLSETKAIFSACESSRFGFSDGTSKTELYNQLEQLIQKLA